MNSLKQKYISSAALLLVASVVVKCISAVYKIPLTAYIGATGRGYFNIAYNLYMPLHAVIMGAFPVAVSHLVSKYNEGSAYSKICSLKKGAGILFFAVGSVGMLIMILFAKPYACLISSAPQAVLTVLLLSPSVLFSSLAASKRALAEGYMNMLPTSVSQIIEAVFKVVFGLLFAKYTMSFLYNRFLETGLVLGARCVNETEALSSIYPITSAAAILGVTVGSIAAYIYVSAYTSVKYSTRGLAVAEKTSSSIKELLSFSAPIVLTTLIQSMSSFIDNASIQYALGRCDVNLMRIAFAECLAISPTPDKDLVAYIYGIFSSAQDFKNIIPGFAMSLGVAAVPAISAAYEKADKQTLLSLSGSIFKYTAIIGFGGGFYLSLIAGDMLEILYKNSNYDIVIGSVSVVRLYGFFMILFTLSSVAVFAVQAIGAASKSIPLLVFTAILRVGINFLLVSNYKINIIGAVVADVAAYAFLLAGNIHIFKKEAGIKLGFAEIIFKPLLCSAGAYMGCFCLFNNAFSLNSAAASFVVSSIIYFVLFVFCMLVSKTVRISEFKILQYCKKMA